MKILVAGGAGYIGSHCVRQLMLDGHEPVVMDSLVTGHRAAVPSQLPFYQVDLRDFDAVGGILQRERIELVMHFAAFASVSESVNDPLKYYLNNVTATLTLIRAMVATGVLKLVFSSTCATYGIPVDLPINEDCPQVPINPYGQTKLVIENALRSFGHAYGMRFAAFRYFNAAGAAPDATLGEHHEPETHLIPLAIGAAFGRREPILVYGRDYPTPDGTCLRDYVHVDDLGRAHIAAIAKLADRGAALFYNLGTGRPYSVQEVITAVECVTGRTVPFVNAPRRMGDPPSLYANPERATFELGWVPQYTDIQSIIATAYKWHLSHPNGFCTQH